MKRFFLSHLGTILVVCLLVAAALLVLSNPERATERFEAAWSGLVSGNSGDGEAGEDDAQFLLGGVYDEGELVKRDAGRAIKWYRLAAAAGNPAAQYNLGLMLKDGDGIKKSARRAVTLFKKAAEQDVPQAQRMLANCFLAGTGVRRDLQSALYWLSRAAELGDEEAQAIQADLGP